MNTNNAMSGGGDFNDDPWYKGSPQASPIGGQTTNQGGGYPNYYSNATNSMNSGIASSYGVAGGEEDYDNEPPLLEELGIRFDHIWSKTQAVLYLNKVGAFFHQLSDIGFDLAPFFLLLYFSGSSLF
jgi:hypothetical protein